METYGRFLKTVVRVGLEAIPTVFLIILLNFVLMQLAPGNAVDAILGDSGADSHIAEALRQTLGLDQSVISQFWSYLGNLVRFDLGTSLFYVAPVAEVIGSRVGYTLILMSVTFVLSILVGSLLGILAASFQNSWLDRAISLAALTLYSMPSFWLGLMLIVLFASQLGWFPSGGTGTVGMAGSPFERLVAMAPYLVLPAISASSYYIAIYTRLARSAMLEVRSQEFVRAAVAKGLPPLRITFAHVLRNALLPITTIAGLHVGGMLGGAVITETIFGWPGLGRLLVEAVSYRDYPILLGILFMSSLLVIFANMIIDIVQALLDPRIEVR